MNEGEQDTTFTQAISRMERLAWELLLIQRTLDPSAHPQSYWTAKQQEEWMNRYLWKMGVR